MHHVGCLTRAEHYHDLAKRYLRLAASTEYPNHYLRIAVQYNTLAEAEELRALGHAEDDWHFDRFGLMDGVIVPAVRGAEHPRLRAPRPYGHL